MLSMQRQEVGVLKKEILVEVEDLDIHKSGDGPVEMGGATVDHNKD